MVAMSFHSLSLEGEGKGEGEPETEGRQEYIESPRHWKQGIRFTLVRTALV